MRRRLLPFLLALPLLLAGCFADGVHHVGTADGQVKPGLYTTPGSSSCYFARLRDFTRGLDSIIQNEIGSGRMFVEVLPTDAGVESSRCGRWFPAPPELPSFNATPNSAIPDGMHRVGVDVMPGTWRTNGPAGGSCYWSRVKDWQGGLDSMITNDIGPAPRTVTILPTDVGFTSSRCTGWTKVG
jgi:hypothetical protein